MRIIHLSLLALPVLSSAFSHNQLADLSPEPELQPVISILSGPAAQITEPTLLDEHLAPRQAPAAPIPPAAVPGNGGAVGGGGLAQPPPPAAAVQYPSITTLFLPTHVAGGGVTYMPVVYTQTFAPVPDQWPAPGVGEIGLGGDAKGHKKREMKTEVPVQRREMSAGRGRDDMLWTAGLGLAAAAALIGAAAL